MGNNTPDMIKGRIAETIAEELFRDLGFYMIKFGKEHTISPLIQLQNFVRDCGGKFTLEKDHVNIFPISYINKLPDFVIVDKTGRVGFLEVKFRKNAHFYDKDKETLEMFNNANVLIVNLNLDNFNGDYAKESTLNELKNTRFHVWIHRYEKKGDKLLKVLTLKKWLKEKYEIEPDSLIEKYESYVVEWLK